jgi:hypothetical protein
MMFKCCECGHLFEDGEQAVWYENQGECHGVTAMERFSGCPLCHDDYEEVHQCKECGEWHTEDELYEGWCEKCLRETINYDTFFEYCEANKDEQYLDIFVMSELLGGMDCPKNVSYEFHELMVDAYKARVDDIKSAMTASYKAFIDILPACIRFIMDDDSSIGRENYADWLNKREADNGKK